MHSTEGVAERFAPLAAKVESQIGGELPAAIRFWDGSEISSVEPGTATDTVIVKDRRALSYVLARPDQVGIGRAWVAGDLDLDGDLKRVMDAGSKMYGLELSAADKFSVIAQAARLGAIKFPPPKPPSSEAKVRGRIHSLLRDRDAVQYHYDVSNDFYRMILGPTMVYSCAYFSSPEDTLEEAQTRKLDVICRKLDLQPGDRFLDIGCGWGSLVLHAATHFGVKAVGVTLAEEQAKLGRQRIKDAGLEDSCEIRVLDYREIEDGPFDKIASVGMYEHVGSAQLDVYMRRLLELSRPGGLVLNHGIVRNQEDNEPDDGFIRRYVFPDGELHYVSAVIEALEKAGLHLEDSEALGAHYALTLRKWVDNLAANKEAAVAEVGEERERIWRLYMTASIGAFERTDVSLQQLLAVVPGATNPRPLARPSYLAS